MAGERSKYFNVNVENELTFATALGAQPDQLLPTREGTLSYNFRPEVLADDTTRNTPGEHPPIAGSKVGSTLDFGTHFHGITRTTGTPQRAAIGDLLVGFMGVERIFDDDTVAVGTDQENFTLTTQSALTLTGTVWVGCDLTGAGVEWRPGTLTSGAFVLDYGFSVTPTASDTIYGTASYQFASDPGDSVNSFQAQVLTDEPEEKYLALGCIANSVTLSFGNRQVPTLDFSCLVTDWTDAESDFITNITPPLKSPWFASQCILIPHADSTYDASDQLPVKGALTATITRGFIPRDDPNASQGSSNWDSPGDPALDLGFSVVTQDRFRDQFGLVADQQYHMIVTSGSVAGRTAGIYFGKVHLKDYPAPADQGGIMIHNLSFGLTEDGANGGIVIFQG